MSEVNQAAYRVSDDGKVVPCGPDEQPDVIYDENGQRAITADGRVFKSTRGQP